MAIPTAVLHDPDTFTRGVPFDVIEQLRSAGPVHWVDEPELPGLPAGSGYHLVIDHGLVTEVVKDPATYSSALGGTQIRDPATPRDLDYVRRMMLNMDPPEHTRLRKLIAASFTPRAVRALETESRDMPRELSTACSTGHRSATSRRTSRPTCRCSRSRPSWGCRRRIAG